MENKVIAKDYVEENYNNPKEYLIIDDFDLDFKEEDFKDGK